MINDIFELAYSKFVSKYPDMPYIRTSIQLWSINSQDYSSSFFKACDFLGINTDFTASSLADRETSFRAEVIKSEDNAIILFNNSISNCTSEAIHIILHELSHLYCDKKTAFFDSFILNSDSNKQYLHFAIRLWREYSAEYISYSVFSYDPNFSNERIRKDFFALLKNKNVIPERIAFFLYECRLRFGLHNDSYLALELDTTNEWGTRIIGCIKELLSLLSNPLIYFSNSTSVINSMIFIGETGFEMIFYYLSYYNYVDSFLLE